MCTDARRAGWLYLLVVLTGVFSLLWVPSQVPLGEGGAALLDRMRAHEALFRWGIAAFVVMQVAFALLPLALHRLLAPAGPRAAAAAAAGRPGATPIEKLSVKAARRAAQKLLAR